MGMVGLLEAAVAAAIPERASDDQSGRDECLVLFHRSPRQHRQEAAVAQSVASPLPEGFSL